MDRLYHIKDTLIAQIQAQMSNLQQVDAKELGEVIDMVKDIEEAVQKAHSNTTSGDIVTLSPACASFDAFTNFMARGNYFKDLVNKL